jgi:hypothetical protein
VTETFHKMARGTSTAVGRPKSFFLAVAVIVAVGHQRATIPLFGHMAAHHRRRYDDRHLPDGLPHSERWSISKT